MNNRLTDIGRWTTLGLVLRRRSQPRAGAAQLENKTTTADPPRVRVRPPAALAHSLVIWRGLRVPFPGCLPLAHLGLGVPSLGFLLVYAYCVLASVCVYCRHAYVAGRVLGTCAER